MKVPEPVTINYKKSELTLMRRATASV